MSANKVILNGETIIDLTQDTVTEDSVALGYTFHKANGEKSVGKASFSNTKPNGQPISVSTEADMTALLESGNVGSVYKYTGTTGTYENGAYYVLEVEETPDDSGDSVQKVTVAITNTKAPSITVYYYDLEKDTKTETIANISGNSSTEITVDKGACIAIFASRDNYFNIPWFQVTSLSGDITYPKGDINPIFVINSDGAISGYGYDDD